jgi:hypothetical protein
LEIGIETNIKNNQLIMSPITEFKEDMSFDFKNYIDDDLKEAKKYIEVILKEIFIKKQKDNFELKLSKRNNRIYKKRRGINPLLLIFQRC